MTSMTYHVWLACLVLAATTIHPLTAAGASSPPSYLHLAAQSPAVVDLRAPSHLNSLSPLDRQLQLQHSTNLRRRQSTSSTNSTDNPNDKLSTLGLLSGAYDLPLNLSSSPSQLVFVQLDTGSSDLWITSSSCNSAQCQKGDVLKFDPSRSSTFQTIEVQGAGDLNLTASSFGNNGTTNAGNSTMQRRQSGAKEQVAFSITYSDTTSASGILAADTASLFNTSVTGQAFALINSTNVTLSSQGISGVLGLGFPRGSTISRSLVGYQDQLGSVSTLPLMTNLLQSSNESYPLFGLYLTTTGGRATFGAVDPQILPSEEARSQVEWFDVTPFPSGDTSLPSNSTLNIDGPALGAYVQWVLPLTSAGVGGSPATLTPTYSQVGQYPLALIDSGSSSILGPAQDVASIFSKILNSRHVGGGRFVVPCDTTSRMYFSFGGRNLTLLPEDYIIGPDAQQPYLCFAWPAAAAPDATGVDWILGTPFLRTVYSLFSIGIDYKEPPKVGFYPLRQQANATASSVVFQPEPTASLSSWLSQATSINSVLPNSLVSLEGGSTAAYFFGNATTTESRGAVPTRVGAPSTYSAALPTRAAGRVQGQLPAVASSSSPLPAPKNPAATGSGGASNAGSSLKVGGLGTVVIAAVAAWTML